MSESDHHYDLCVIGAGIAGLNAAFVATRYLPATARIVIIDRHEQPGGMWNDAYSYVRLHQPHRLFTVGDLKWKLDQPPDYLATRDEVAAHLRNCFEDITQRARVEARWQWTYVRHVEDDGGVTVVLRNPAGVESEIRTDKLIKATGFDIEMNPALTLTSRLVESVAPVDLAASGLLSDADDRPVWVIGSGKTATDSVVAIAQANPRREIGMVTGSGTYFFNRDAMFPGGKQRFIGGKRPNLGLSEIADLFDGTNVDEVVAEVQTGLGIGPLDNAQHAIFGIISEREVALVRDRIGPRAVRDHLEDVIDVDQRPVMTLRSGAQFEIDPGAVIVNCTSHFVARDVAYEPYASAGGRVMSVNSSSVTLGFSSFSSYFLTHLMFSKTFREAPLYAVDFNAVRRIDPKGFTPAGCALLFHNLSVLTDALPTSAFIKCGLDFDAYYPPYRRGIGQARFLFGHHKQRARLKAALDRYAAVSGISLGPLNS